MQQAASDGRFFVSFQIVSCPLSVVRGSNFAILSTLARRF